MNTLWAIGIRNVSRNRRRTRLTIGGIAFAVWLIGVSASLQDGTYALQRQTATDLLTGHVQISHPEWPGRSAVELVIPDVAVMLNQLSSEDGVERAFPRIHSFGLAASGERSVAAQVIGMDFAKEQGATTILHRLADGVIPSTENDALVGEALARSLDVRVDDDIDVLATDPGGGMAAMSLRVSGVLRTGVPDLDRLLLLVPYVAMSDALAMPDQAHLIVIRGERREAAQALATRVEGHLPKNPLVRPWQEVMPEIEEAIELDRLGGYPFYGVILFLVTFSVANTFVMVVFERVREFGMLRSLGMQPLRIIGLLQIESFVLWCGGVALGLVLLLLTVSLLATVGVSLGDQLEATLSQMYMPDHLYADFSLRAFLTAPLVLLLNTQLAALLPALRIRHIQPAHTLRMGA